MLPMKLNQVYIGSTNTLGIPLPFWLSTLASTSLFCINIQIIKTSMKPNIPGCLSSAQNPMLNVALELLNHHANNFFFYMIMGGNVVFYRR